jgi:hypothetical protein
LAALSLLLVPACGSENPSPAQQPASSPSTDPPPSSAVSANGTNPAEAALLAPTDVSDGWQLYDHRFVYPNSAEMARQVPECSPFAEVVFEGGSRHGTGAAEVLGDGLQMAWTYVVVFDSVDAAKAMMAAVADPRFDSCWAKFNNVAVPAMPFGFTSASYQATKPPTLHVDADDLAVKHLEGTVTGPDGSFADTCTCAFARVGRGVVELHSTDGVFDPERRSAVVQAAVDKLRSTLSD